MTKAYEETIKELAQYIRSELQKIDELHSMSFEIEVSGRVHDGEVSIKFGLGNSYNLGGRVQGGSVEAVLNEYMRRFGWDRLNKPLELSFNKETF